MVRVQTRARRAPVTRRYDEANRRLVYYAQSADSDYWDGHWDRESELFQRLHDPVDDRVTLNTKRFLSASEGPVLEAGCGVGLHVSSLKQAGFDAVGLDFAASTIRRSKNLRNDLKFVAGDVRRVPFRDDSFAGLWSIGVIEHFFDGYDPIASEMLRVIAPGGCLFLTYPQLSALRQAKARAGCYARFSTTNDSDDFYQFALCPDRVGRAMSDLGFDLIEQRGFDGLKGVRDELGFLGRGFASVIHKAGGLAATRVLSEKIRFKIDALCGHSVMQVYRKPG